MDLQSFFQQHQRAAIAFSGGVDSAYLLYAALAWGKEIQPYYVKSAFQPQFELDDALRLCERLHVPLKVLSLDVLADDMVRINPKDRCYYCKRRIFSLIAATARADGYEVLLDGTNASDDASDRPGMRALEELQVLSPLRLCGISKSEVRQRSREAGLFTWDKPAYACLATRIPTGEPITMEALDATEKGEALLMALGFRDIRIRRMKGCARLQVPKDQMALVLEKRCEIVQGLKPWYSAVMLDLEDRG